MVPYQQRAWPIDLQGFSSIVSAEASLAATIGPFGGPRQLSSIRRQHTVFRLRRRSVHGWLDSRRK